MKDPNLSELIRMHPLLAVSGSAGVSGHSPVFYVYAEKTQHEAVDDLAASAGDSDRRHQRYHSAGILWK